MVGLAAVVVVSVALLVTIDRTMGQIWRVSRQRPWSQRLLLYWAGLTLGPLLLGGSLAISSYLFTGYLSGLGDWLPPHPSEACGRPPYRAPGDGSDRSAAAWNRAVRTTCARPTSSVSRHDSRAYRDPGRRRKSSPLGRGCTPAWRSSAAPPAPRVPSTSARAAGGHCHEHESETSASCGPSYVAARPSQRIAVTRPSFRRPGCHWVAAAWPRVAY